MPAAPAAIPPKPSIAAMMAITRKVIVQRNIVISLDFKNKLPKTLLKNRATKYLVLSLCKTPAPGN